ncbi:protein DETOXIFICATION 16 [Arachis duranensis]|uniref:Protein DETOXIFICATION n=1 Tax=Arachis duranensis TaxID=130453 RepID=A0A6P4D0P0_ARADU|nr:protein DETOXIFICATION 16 [Arachis duranensis]
MKIPREAVVEELKRQLWLAVPLCSVAFLQYSLQTISIMFVGHLGTLPLSGASMATSFAAVTGFTLLTGLTGALDTFCGQSNGAGQYQMLGIHLQRSMLVVSVVSVFVAIIWANTEPILIAMRQDKAIANQAGKYARCLIPSLFAHGLLQSILRFLQTQSIVFPMVITSALAALLHILLCWLLVFKTPLGSRGAPISISICYYLNLLFISFYIKYSSSCKQSWTGFSKKSLNGVFSFLKLAVPSALMLCLKVWTFELVVILSGLLPNPALETSVLSICLNTFTLAWMIPFGFSAAVSTRVSNELGGGNPEAARVAVGVVLCMVFIEGILLASIMIMLRNMWSRIYSNDKQVIRDVSATTPILAVSCFLDGIQSALSGIASGCGWQRIGAYVNLGSFYLVGVPCSVLLGFVAHMKAKGLWLGIIAAFVVQVTFYAIITIRTSWDQQARIAESRVKESTMSPKTECEV